MDRPAVRRSVFYYFLFLVSIQAGIALLMAVHPGPPRLALYYLFGAIPWTLLVGVVLVRNIHLLYTIEGRPLRRLNPATRVTLLRVLCIPLLIALILADQRFAATAVFLAAALTDWLDGFLARRMKDVTQLGRIIDPTIDAVFCGLTMVTLYFAGTLALWVVLAGLLRYGLLSGGAGYLKYTYGYVSTRATFFGRMFYFLQYTLLTLALLIQQGGVALWLNRFLGGVQILVSVLLILLGITMIMEARIAAH
jgi:cardiolipin synthase